LSTWILDMAGLYQVRYSTALCVTYLVQYSTVQYCSHQ
jgi:hypothetical protein